MTAATSDSTLERLNTACFCLSLDQQALAHALDAELGEPGLAALVRERCPYVFAAQPVFVAPTQLQRVAQVVRAIESVVTLPAYREQVLASAPAIARAGGDGSQGVFLGYDFHLDQGRLGLIEINTNAGGAMLNAVLARAQRSCCAATASMVPSRASIVAFEQQIVDMFRREWRLAGHSKALASIAIVDEEPERQYLYPEFLLFRQLFERHGLRAVIAAPAELEWRHGRLWHGEQAIDLVYNRLTDFYIEQPASAMLREAWLAKGVVLTPHPLAHALYADKRRLVIFSDATRLQALGVPEDTRELLVQHVPHTETVDSADGERLWAARRDLFFKPFAGYGSRAAYRGDKLTRRVWDEILAGGYVAQAIVPPGQRQVGPDDEAQAMKYDLRAYAYGDHVQWVAARLYRGQTTNFRTPGGGFAPVYTTAKPSAGVFQTDREHASYAFLLGDPGEVHPLPHPLYVALARHEATAPTLAGRTLRLADWYVRLHDGEPEQVVHETYGMVHVDATEYLEYAPQSTGGAVASTAKRERMRAMLFDRGAALA